jgi:hypothetical protein
LAHIPDHDASEAGEGFAVGDYIGKGTATFVASPCSGVSRDAENDFDVRVQGDGFGPVVPGVEVEVVLSAGANGERLQAAVVVIELDPDSVEGNLASKHRSIGCVWIWTLWSGGEVIGLSGRRSGSRHEIAELISKSRHVADGRFEIEIKAIDNRASKRTRD